MGSEASFIPEIGLFGCPFMSKCKLPKHQILCKIPECKTCPDYDSYVKKLKSRVLY